jgi:multiple sugar transport system permease protein
MTAPSITADPGERSRARRGRRRRAERQEQIVGGSPIAGYFFVALYVALLLMLGIAPTVYALYLSLTAPGGGLTTSNFVTAFHDYRFLPAFAHIGEFVAIWLISQTVLVVGLALLVHGMLRRTSPLFRFLYYLPGALAGAASVIVWLFMLDPEASPFGFILRWFGFTTFVGTATPGNLPMIFAVMAFWTGAGGWIVVTYGALNNIPTELIEAAEIDGSNAFQTAFRIKLPLIRKWIVYMLVLSFAGGTQLFVEPTILGKATSGIGISPYWSPNQLAWYLASYYDRYNEAAAISVDLLVVGLIIAGLLVWRGRLFEVE